MAALLFMKRMAETADIKAWKYTDSPDITPGEAEKLRDIFAFCTVGEFA